MWIIRLNLVSIKEPRGRVLERSKLHRASKFF